MLNKNSEEEELYEKSRHITLYESFPLQSGVFRDFQSDDSVILDLPSTLDPEILQTFAKTYKLHDWTNEKDSKRKTYAELVNTNLLLLIFDQITVCLFSLMTEEASCSLYSLMYLQVGGFNPYDCNTPMFSQYSTTSIIRNLEKAFKYYKQLNVDNDDTKKALPLKLDLFKISKEIPEKGSSKGLIQDHKLMMKFLLEILTFPQAFRAWTLYKYFIWTMNHFNLSNYDTLIKCIQQKEAGSCKLKCYVRIWLIKYLCLFYGMIDSDALKEVLFEMPSIFESIYCSKFLSFTKPYCTNEEITELLSFYKKLLDKFNIFAL